MSTARLLSTMRLDVIVQWRSKLYYIGAAVALGLAFGLGTFLSREWLATALPIMFLFAVGGTTMLYVAGLVLFEKGERTLEALTVTPISVPEYLTSKVVTLSTLALLESLITTVIAYGLTGYNWLLLVPGVLLLGIMLTLMGFVMVVRYQSITDFFVPMLIIGIVTQLPFVHFVGLLPSPLWYLVPTAAPATLMWAAYNPVPNWQIAYGLLYSLAWVAGLAWWALRAFEHHIVLKV